MKKIEITLKVGFILLALALIITGQVNTMGLMIFLVVSFVLGGILIINKDSSYSHKHTKKEWVMRRIEGVLLVVFSLFAWCWLTGVVAI